MDSVLETGSSKTSLGVVSSDSPVTGFVVAPESTDTKEETPENKSLREIELEKEVQSLRIKLGIANSKLTKSKEYASHLYLMLNEDYEQDPEDEDIAAFKNHLQSFQEAQKSTFYNSQKDFQQAVIEEERKDPVNRDPNTPPPLPTTPPPLPTMTPPPLPESLPSITDQQETTPINLNNTDPIAPIDPLSYNGSLEPGGVQALNADILKHNQDLANGTVTVSSTTENNNQATLNPDDTRRVTPPPLPTTPPPLPTTPPPLQGYAPVN